MKKVPATFDFEKTLWNKNKEYIVGIDEVGRGAWAGPLVAAAVIFPRNFSPKISFYDSKLLSAEQRETLATVIKKEALGFGVGIVAVETIVRQGLTFSNQLAYKKALENLTYQPDHYLIDAFRLQDIELDVQTPIIKGDYYCASIASASIIAKVFRDELMRSLSRMYQPYKFDSNKGYGTKTHQEAILRHGLTDIHRTNYNLKILQ